MIEREMKPTGHPPRTAPGAAKELRNSRVLAFAHAFLGGSLIAAVSSFIPVAMLSRGGPAGAVYWIHFSCFLGGFFAGGRLPQVVRDRRWPLFWLAAGSPALPVWICTIIALGTGTKMAPWVLHLTVISCIAAIAGAVGGFYVIPPLKEWTATPKGIFLKTFGRALLLGVLTVFAAGCVTGMIGELVGIGRGGRSPTQGGEMIVGGILLLAGGFVSGREIFPALPRGFSRWPCLALVSPTSFILFCKSLSDGPASLFRGWYTVGDVLRLLFWTITPILGAFAGYRFELRKRRTREGRAATGRAPGTMPEARDD